MERMMGIVHQFREWTLRRTLTPTAIDLHRLTNQMESSHRIDSGLRWITS